MPEIDRITVIARGRPAPQGSKLLGPHGQMRESSVYLRPWAQAVKRAVFERYAALGIRPDELPLFRGPVGVSIRFHLDTGDRIDSPPDLDKLARAVFDVLGPPPARKPRETDAAYARRCIGRGARVWEDDGRVVRAELAKEQAAPGLAGAEITVWEMG